MHTSLHRCAALVLCTLTMTLASRAQGVGSPPDPRLPAGSAWTPFSDTIVTTLHLSPDQRQRVTEVDLRFRKAYDAMGNTPWNDPRYPALQDQRNMDVRGILDQDQYKQWLDMNRPVDPDRHVSPPPPPPPPDH